MKITHIISMPAAGGAEVFVRDLAIQMARAGHEVFVMFLESAAEAGRDERFSSDFLEALLREGIGFEILGRRCRRNPIAGILGVRSHTRRWKPDLIHAHLYYGAVFAAFAPVRLVYTHHSIRLKVSKALYRYLLDFRVLAYVGICAACSKVLRQTSRRRVVQIDNGVDPDRLVVRKASAARAQRPRVIAVGRLAAEKNFRMLISAVAALADVDFTLRIVGEGPEREALGRLAAELGVDHKVEFTGNSTNVPELLADSDLFVMSSAWEGLPISLIEATLSGLPVLVTDVGGCSEVVRNVGNGIVVESLDVSGFTRQLRRLLTMPDLRAQLATNGRENSGRYRLDVSMRRHLALYSEVIDNEEVA